MIDVLLVLKALPEAALRALVQKLQESCTVVSTMRPRLMVCRVPPHGEPMLHTLPGVMAVIHNATELAALPGAGDLSDTEVLFASAWATQGQKKGPRAGAGRDWDAPGFAPPDRPPH